MSEAGAVNTGKPYSDDDKIHLFLAYFGIFALIPFFMFRDKRQDPQKEYVYWHARQGLALFIVAMVIWLVGMVGMVIPFLNILVGLLLCAWWVLIVVMMIVGMVKAFGGQKWEMPGIVKVAEMFK
ncbi:MAG: DUF4870 domain-containing protein [Acidobacteriota bacterium]|jgi:uncharacterized membrane protein